MSESIRVSIIVAIYNIDRYLKSCIESIIHQTYNDIEVILVDDGSTDECYSICEYYKTQDSRITVIHKKNGGLVTARKAGIEKFTGDYVLFVDGDDWLEEDYIEQFVKVIQNNKNVDIIVAGYNEYVDGKCIPINHNTLDGVYSGRSLYDVKKRAMNTEHFYTPGIYPALWNKLFSRHIVVDTNIEVDNRIKMGEDAAFFYPRLFASDCAIIQNSLRGYNYRIISSSMSHKFETNYFHRIYILYQSLIKNVSDIEYKKAIEYYYLFLFLGGIKLILFDRNNIFYLKKHIEKAVGIDVITRIIKNVNTEIFDAYDLCIIKRLEEKKYNMIIIDSILNKIGVLPKK